MNKASTDKIRFHFLTKPFNFRNRTKLKSFLLKQIKEEGKTVDSLNYVFCSDAYLLEVNRKYLNHDTYTDIITFELSPKGQPLLSDIYISIERVKENAEMFNSSFKKELHRVIFHGFLHLIGYKDKSPKEELQMRTLEELLLSQYLVPRETSKKI